MGAEDEIGGSAMSGPGSVRGRSRLARLAFGARALLRGFRFVLGHASLWPWVAAPGLLTLAVTAALAGGAYRLGHGFVAAHLGGHGALLAALLWLLLILFVVAVGYLAFLTVSLVATAPFSGTISEKTERLLTGAAPGPEGIPAQIFEAGRELLHTIFALACYLALAAILLALHLFVPPLVPFTWPLSLTLTAIFLAYDAFDLPLSRRRFGFGQKWRRLWEHGAESLGFGLAVALLLALPGLNLVVPAVAASGGTLLFLELDGEPARSVL